MDDEIRKSVHQSAFAQSSGSNFVPTPLITGEPAKLTKDKHFHAAPSAPPVRWLPISCEAPSLSANLTETKRQILPQFFSACERRRILRPSVAIIIQGNSIR
jgi:hypothetical protein